MAVNVQDIYSSQWSISLSVLGEVVTDLEDIKQCIYIIIATVKGTDPLRPEFGCGLYDWIDEPMTVAAPKIVRDIRTAIGLWESRVTVQDITFSFGIDGQAYFTLVWQPVAGTLPGGITTFVIDDGVIYLVDEFNRRFLIGDMLLII